MVIDSILSFGPPAIIISRNIEPPIAMMESAKTHKVSILRSAETTSQVTAALFQYLNKELALELQDTVFLWKFTVRVVCCSVTAV